jgi:multidrug efflux system membrane fusion protein
MTTNTTPTDLKTLPDVHRIDPPGHSPDQKPSGGKKRAFIWVFFLVVIAAVAGYAVWRAGQPGLIPVQNNGRGGGGPGGRGGAGAVLPVVVAVAKKAAVPVYLNGLGNVTAFYTVGVQSRVAGQLMSVNFKEGDLVQQGQVLAEIDPRPYQVMLEQAEGTLAHDSALLADAKLDLDRYVKLLAQDAIPSQQLDTQKALVAQYEGSIKQDIANVDNAKLQLTYARVTAPITGVVGLRQIDPGNIIQTNSAAFIVITQLQPISVLFTIPEDSLPQVQQKVRAGAVLTADAYNRDNSVKIATGIFQTVDNQIDNTTGTSKLKAVFDNKDNALFPQQFVNVRLHVDTLQDQIVIPTVAVQQGQQGTFVYKIDDQNKAHLQVVKVGVGDQTQTAITSGLEVGDQVAVDGADRLQDGSVVRIRRAGELEQEAAADAAALAANRGRGRAGKKGGDGAFKKGDGKKGGFKKKGGGDQQ